MVATKAKQLCSKLENNIVCADHINNVHASAPCDHEQVDIRIILHILYCAKQGYDSVIIETVDTDVVTLAIAAFHSIPMLKKLWIDCVVNKHHRYISAHGIARLWIKRKQRLCRFFLHSQDVIPFRLSMEQEKRKLGKLGKFYLL